MNQVFLSVQNLSISFETPYGLVHPVQDVSFDVIKGQTTALVGESGSGKSLCALTILRLLNYPQARHPSGQIRFGNEMLLNADVAEDASGIANRSLIQKIRRQHISFIFQEPMTALNPLHTVGKLLHDSLAIAGEPYDQLATRSLALLQQVEFDNPEQYLSRYPHQLSGGQRQRVMIAMALAANPEMLIADEPTTALDVTTQAQILQLLHKLQKQHALTILFISHDLGIVRHIANSVYVLHKGKVVESGKATQVLSKPKHAYTKGLINAEPEGKPAKLPPKNTVLLEVDNLNVVYGQKSFFSSQQPFHALKNVSFDLERSQTLGVVGESGSGKSTLGLAVLKLIRSQGQIVFHDQGSRQDVNLMNRRELALFRPRVQIVFQDPFSSLNPRFTLFDIIAEGVRAQHYANRGSRDSLEALVQEALQRVELPEDYLYRYPHELSGGQRQRVAIARSLIMRPQILVLDEPTSALDKPIQKEVLNLLRALQKETGISYIFISHDLKVIRTLAHKVLVMKNGVICEQGSPEQIFTAPEHPYTKSLIASALAYS